jgi:hypothetical protein
MDFAQAVQTVGFPGACLVVLGFAAWKALTYLTTQILQPIAKRHLEFIDAMERSQESRDKTGREQADMLQRVVEIQSRQANELTEQTNLLKKVASTAVVQTKIMVEEQRQQTDDRTK